MCEFWPNSVGNLKNLITNALKENLKKNDGD